MRLNYYIAENCSKNKIIAVDKYAVSFLKSIIAQIDSVKNVIVTDTRLENYS